MKKLIREWKSQRRKSEEKVREEEGKKKEDQRRESQRKLGKEIVREKAGKSRNTVLFNYLCSAGSKSRFAKAAGAKTAGQMRDEQMHTVVARSTCPSQKCKKLMASEHC